MLPMEDSWIIIESLKYLKLSKGPRMYLFNRLLDPHNHIRYVLLEEVDVLPCRSNRFSVFVGMGLGKLSEFPVVLFFRRPSEHQ
jgi:hypothetical protein